MLDTFEVITTSGVVLWSKTYAPVGTHIINSLIKDVFIEERTHLQDSGVDRSARRYNKEQYTLKWTEAKGFGLIFVVSGTIKDFFSESAVANF